MKFAAARTLIAFQPAGPNGRRIRSGCAWTNRSGIVREVRFQATGHLTGLSQEASGPQELRCKYGKADRNDHKRRPRQHDQCNPDKRHRSTNDRDNNAFCDTELGMLVVFHESALEKAMCPCVPAGVPDATALVDRRGAVLHRKSFAQPVLRQRQSCSVEPCAWAPECAAKVPARMNADRMDFMFSRLKLLDCSCALFPEWLHLSPRDCRMSGGAVRLAGSRVRIGRVALRPLCGGLRFF